MFVYTFKDISFITARKQMSDLNCKLNCGTEFLRMFSPKISLDLLTQGRETAQELIVILDCIWVAIINWLTGLTIDK